MDRVRNVIQSGILLVVLSAPTVACKTEADNEDGAALSLLALAAATASTNYTVTFTAGWSSATHSGGTLGIPSNPHFSALVGSAHSAALSFWQPGASASSGIEQMAEMGTTSTLAAEFRAAGAQSVAIGTTGVDSPGSGTVTLTVSPQQPVVTLVTMVAPSPDWFVGVHGLSLYENGVPVASKTVSLLVYDAGTDSGATFTAADVDTSPKGQIALLNATPLSNNPVGTFTFVRQ